MALRPVLMHQYARLGVAKLAKSGYLTAQYWLILLIIELKQA
jgi:hypothetical protein